MGRRAVRVAFPHSCRLFVYRRWLCGVSHQRDCELEYILLPPVLRRTMASCAIVPVTGSGYRRAWQTGRIRRIASGGPLSDQYSSRDLAAYFSNICHRPRLGLGAVECDGSSAVSVNSRSVSRDALIGYSPTGAVHATQNRVRNSRSVLQLMMRSNRLEPSLERDASNSIHFERLQNG